MQKKKAAFVVVLFTLFITHFWISAVPASAGAMLLKKGMQGDSVTVLQNDLKSLGYFNVEPTGYFGTITEEAVKRFQADKGLVIDGVVGNMTFSAIGSLKGGTQNTISRGSSDRESSPDYLVSWSNASGIFQIGSVATVYDIDSGLSFKVKRSYGYNHADTETLTAEDAAVMKKAFGGQWSWNRRAIILTVDGTKMAASMAGMPHAGLDKYSENTYVKSRSGGFGAGTNLDAVKGNGMDGHFDIHFLGSKTHGSSRVDGAHQTAVKKAAEWAKNN